jgi:hypothetical protein
MFLKIASWVLHNFWWLVVFFAIGAGLALAKLMGVGG